MTASIINKTIKSIVAASAALIMAASVAACGPNAATPSEENNASNGGATTSKVTARSLDEIKKSGVLKVAVFSDKAPFGYIDKDYTLSLHDALPISEERRVGKECKIGRASCRERV